MINTEVQYNPENVISSNSQLKNKIDGIPDKLGFKIGEVADYVGVKQYVLRYWETEFDVLNPKKSDNGQRMYSRRDIETALVIRKLLHQDRFSIEGARAVFKRLKQQGKSFMELQEEEARLHQQQPKPAPVAKAVHIETPVVLQAPVVNVERPNVVQLEKALAQREKEVNQQWLSSMEYFLEEVKLAKQRLLKA